jgi:hypothetical protein
MVAVIIGFAIFRGDPILTTLQFALVLTVVANSTMMFSGINVWNGGKSVRCFAPCSCRTGFTTTINGTSTRGRQYSY